MIDTGKTLTLAANVLKEKGAKVVYALISHGELMLRYTRSHPEYQLHSGLLSEANMSIIQKLPIEQLVVRFE